MICHLVGALETERLGHGGACHAQFLDESLILPPPQELVTNHEIIPSRHVGLGIIKINKVPNFL